MRKLLFAVAFAALAVLSLAPAVGQAQPNIGVFGDDMLGLYWIDAQNNGWANHYIAAGVLTINLIATGLTDPTGLGGWECRMNFPAALFPAVTLLGDGPINFATPPDYVVGLNSPFPRADAMVLASINLFITSEDPTLLYLETSATPSIPDSMAYASGADFNILRPFNWSSGAIENPVFGINTGMLDPPIPTVESTWGEVKSLYR